jgi:hypothetical protein
MIALFAHLLFAAILSVSIMSHKHNDKNQGEQTKCQISKSK